MNENMRGECWKTRAQVLTVACALVEEAGVALTSLQRMEIRRRRVA